MKHSIYILTLIFSQVIVKGQGLLFHEKEIPTPFEIINIHGDSVIRTTSVDFNGDNYLDFISVVSTGIDYEPLTREYWYTSDFELYRVDDLFIVDYDFKCFINLDNDPIPEIIRASGYSDGIDYYISKQDTSKKDETKLIYFNPIIEKSSKEKINYYWGHPWRLDSLIIKTEKGEIKLKCSLNHQITREGEIYYPENQFIFPVIIFSGEQKSEYDYSKLIKGFEWLTIDEIMLKIKK